MYVSRTMQTWRLATISVAAVQRNAMYSRHLLYSRCPACSNCTAPMELEQTLHIATQPIEMGNIAW